MKGHNKNSGNAFVVLVLSVSWLIYFTSNNSNNNCSECYIPVTTTVYAFTSTPFGMIRPTLLSQSNTAPSSFSSSTSTTLSIPTSTTATSITNGSNTAPLTMTDNNSNDQISSPSTFREAEVWGLKLMQERKYKEALDAFQMAMTLPGSRTDIIRTKSLSGPSPVGGSMGGYESKVTMSLDEFEIQAVQYNMACAYAQLNDIVLAVQCLQTAFDNGFDNYNTVQNDPDLDPIKNSDQYIQLMKQYDTTNKSKNSNNNNNNSNGFNPFGIFGNK